MNLSQCFFFWGGRFCLFSITKAGLHFLICSFLTFILSNAFVCVLSDFCKAPISQAATPPISAQLLCRGDCRWTDQRDKKNRQTQWTPGASVEWRPHAVRIPHRHTHMITDICTVNLSIIRAFTFFACTQFYCYCICLFKANCRKTQIAQCFIKFASFVVKLSKTLT